MQHRIGSVAELCRQSGRIVKMTENGGRTWAYAKVSYVVPAMGKSAQFLCFEVFRSDLGDNSSIVEICPRVFTRYDFYLAPDKEVRGKQWSNPITT